MKHLKGAKNIPKQTQNENSLNKEVKKLSSVSDANCPIFSHIIAFPVCVLFDQKERDLYSLVLKRELERFHFKKY